MPEQTFSGLFDETAHLDWAPSDGLRRRARQRRRRQRFAVGATVAAVVAVVAAGTAFALDPGPGPEPVPPATPAPSVSPSVSGSGPAGPSASAGPGSVSTSSPPALVTDVPLTAMLTPTDVGSSGWSREDGENSGDWQVSRTFATCVSARQEPADGDVRRRWQSLSGPSDRYVLQMVESRPSATAASAYLGRVRSNVNRCAGFAYEGHRYSMSIVDEWSAGDEAFVVRTVGYNNQIQINAFVRVGNLVTEYLHSDDTTDRAFALSTRAATRLCAATRTC